MALQSDEPRPTDLSEKERYAKIWAWYTKNMSRLSGRPDEYAKKSMAYIQNMPTPDSVSADQIADTFNQVRFNLLEWAYHESDGNYKMAAYAGA